MINRQAAMKLLILAGYGGFMIYLLYTGKISMYVHPKMNKYIYGCIILLALFSVVVSKDLFNRRSSQGRQGSIYTVFTGALLLAVLIQPISLNSVLAENRGVTLSLGKTQSETSQKKLPQEKAVGENQEDADIINETRYQIDENGNVPDQASPYKESVAVDLSGPQIIVNEENYMQILDGVYTNLTDVINKEITISGFVFREDGMNDNNFIIARSMITCCAADAAVAGFMCDFGSAGELKNDEWIEVRGILQQATYNDESLPVIMVKEFKKIDKPKNEYLFAY